METQPGYLRVQKHLEAYRKATQEQEKKRHLEKILLDIEPLLRKKIRHYFGTLTAEQAADHLQDGWLRSIELIEAFDPGRKTRFLGYMERMLGCYYFGKRRSQARLPAVCGLDQMQEPAVSEPGFADCEIQDLLSCLPLKAAALLRLHLLEQLTLKEAAQRCAISYAYSKELKKKSLLQLRDRLCEPAHEFPKKRLCKHS